MHETDERGAVPVCASQEPASHICITRSVLLPEVFNRAVQKWFCAKRVVAWVFFGPECHLLRLKLARAAERAALLHLERLHGALNDRGFPRRRSSLQGFGLGKLRCVV